MIYHKLVLIIKELRKLDNYCKEIKKQSESIQDNLNNFDKDLNKKRQFQEFIAQDCFFILKY